MLHRNLEPVGLVRFSSR